MNPMSESNGAAVVVRNVGKRYNLGSGPNARGILRQIARIGRTPGDGSLDERPTIWALRNVSFEVASGEVVGVIGRNGSGKSTLMKILARVTAPTEGSALVVGRVGAMLQVGTGFHPQLTGRENIALSGAILGMSRREVAAVQDQIVEFSEVGRFLDTPVKYYSNGMYTRLAFSVSAHMHAEILLVDEVLSVGDTAFQQKSQERIRSLVSEGRTVLFVSHTMDSVKALCERSIVLEQGQVRFMGPTAEAVAFYQQEVLRLPARKAAG
jgi:lipopolysaccharide transport system ATP-binding protein